VEFGAVLLCISGDALLTVGDRQCLLKVRTEVTLLPNAVCMLLRSSSDFHVKYFSFSPAMFQESSFRLSSSYVGFIKDRIYIQLPDEHFRYSVTFFELLESLYLDISNQYRDRIATNLLQNYLLNACDKITRYNTCVDIRDTDRPTNLFKRFVSLLHTHIVSVRDISFYASSLSISPRYLSAITRRNSSMSAKSFIDDCLLQEIKLLLLSTDLSIQELSDRLHFSDQSHLGRFFKRHTGLSPSVYRKSGNTPPFRE
jgi:AraC-like DNA-binding protein